jgi:adenylate cyclase
MLQLRCRIDGTPRSFPLVGEEVSIGRGPENEIRLPDPSVSRRHAVVEREPLGWVVRDLGSTNGTRHNGNRVQRATLVEGDRLKIGAFELEVEEEGAGAGRRAAAGRRSGPAAARQPPPPTTPRLLVNAPPSKVPHASIVRPLTAFTATYGLGLEGSATTLGAAAEGALAERAPEEAEAAYGNRVFGFLTRLAQLLITAETVPQVLRRVMDIAFEALPVERGFILLPDRDGEIRCELARTGERVEERPQEGVPVSRTIFEAVMEDRVALLTYDALADDRLATGESIRLHGIRAAMSAPLWSGERIIGVIQLDSPVQVGAFGERDLDFLTALANYAAVAVEGLENARRAERERRLRSRFERYHSPAVIEEMMRESEAGEAGEGGAEVGGLRELRVAEATVLFADLVGFTAFAERAPPEEVAALLEGFFNQAVEAVFEAGGTLDKFIGDAVMAFFGAPLAQADHARRGVEAALRLQRELGRWNAERGARGLPEVAARIAINSGPVVVGDVGSARRVDYTVLGNTVNVASRLEQFVARPGDVVIGEETHRLLAGAFDSEVLGQFQLKGLQQKVRAFRVIGAP